MIWISTVLHINTQYKNGPFVLIVAPLVVAPLAPQLKKILELPWPPALHIL